MFSETIAANLAAPHAYLEIPAANNQTGNRGSVGGEGGASEWVISMREKLFDKSSCCIYPHPEVNKEAYVPQLVSIGPFYLGTPQSSLPLQPYKIWYLRRLLPQIGDPMRVFNNWLDIVKGLEKQAREYYSETIGLDSNAFAMMMLLDSCFIIALFRMKKGELSRENGNPLFNRRWMMPVIRKELLMLGNQIPFFILKKVFDLINNEQDIGSSSLHQLALNFFKESNPNLDMEVKLDEEDEPLHLLHLFYTSLIPEAWRKKSKEEYPTVKRIYCVTKLKDAGLKLKKGEGRHGFLDIKFDPIHGILEMPPIQVQDITCSQFMNLIAFEQFYSRVPTLITAYALFMDCLIDSPQDAGYLCQKGMIENWLGNDEELAHMFNKLCRGVVIQTDGCYLANVFLQVNDYCNKSWHVWRQSLMRDYFRNPWAIISVAAAAFILILTLIQAIMAILAR